MEDDAYHIYEDVDFIKTIPMYSLSTEIQEVILSLWNEMGGCYIRSDTFEGESVRQDIRDGIIDGSEGSK